MELYTRKGLFSAWCMGIRVGVRKQSCLLPTFESCVNLCLRENKCSKEQHKVQVNWVWFSPIRLCFMQFFPLVLPHD